MWNRISRLSRAALVAAVCAAVALTATAVAAATQGEPVEVEFYDRPFPYDYQHIGRASPEFNTDYWHYAGGYWYDGALSEPKFVDTEHMFWDHPESYYDRPGMNIRARAVLPANVKAYLSGGGAESGRKLGISVIPEHSDAVNTAYDVLYSIEGDYITIHAKPKFVIDGDQTYRDFVPELHDVIPIVKEGYGWNIYSMYNRGGAHIGEVGSSMHPHAGKIEFTDILDIYGNLRPGKKLRLVNTNAGGREFAVPSADVNIGKGTFNSAGAVGMWYHFKFDVDFYLERPGDLEVTEIDGVNKVNAGKQITCVVTVRNNMNMPYTGGHAALLRLSDGIREKTVTVELEAGEEKAVRVPWKAPTPEELEKLAAEDTAGGALLPDGDGSRVASLNLTATLNPGRLIEETDYENNTVVRRVLIGLPAGTLATGQTAELTAEPGAEPGSPFHGAVSATDYSVVGFREGGYLTNRFVETYVRVRRDGAGGEPEADGRRAVSVAFYDGRATQYRGVVLEPGAETEIAFEWFTPREPGQVTLSAHINPERTVAESDYTNNKRDCAAEVDWPPTDLAVVGVSPPEYPAGLRACTLVRVRNTGERDFSGDRKVDVRLSVPSADFEHTIEINLNKNAEFAVPFMWAVPSDTTEFRLTATVNPSRAIEETDYSNNELNLDVSAGTDTNPELGDDVARREWEEERFITNNYSSITGSDGNPVEEVTPVYDTQDFYAEVALSATLNKAAVKSGYGVECEVETTLDTDYDLAEGVTGIQEVYAYLPQSGYTEAIKLENVPDETDLWRFPVNPSSVTGARVQYIPVEWPDGETYEIRFAGLHGQSPGGEMSASGSATTLVSGNMYEDDYTAPAY